MGRRKQTFILISTLLLLGAWGLPFAREALCVEDDANYRLIEVDKKLERLEIYFETEMYEEASILLNELISQFPDEPSFKYLNAIIDYQRGNYDLADAIFVEFIEQYPQAAEPYYLLAQISLEREDLDLARSYLAKYCALVPGDTGAQDKLRSILNQEDSQPMIIIQNGRADPGLVERVGFYGGCVHSYQEESIKLVNGSFCTWSSMGIDFIYPLDLRGKKVVFKLKGKQGGESLELTFRDKFAKNYTPQLVLAPE